MPEITKYSIQSSTLTDIADAIREKKRTSSPITVSSFASEIETMSGGGFETINFNVTSTTYTVIT